MEEDIKKWLERKKRELESTKSQMEEVEVKELEQGLKLKEDLKEVPVETPRTLKISEPVAEPSVQVKRTPVFPPRSKQTEPVKKIRPKLPEPKTGIPTTKPKIPERKTSRWRGRILVAIIGCISAIIVFIIYKFFFMS